MIICPSCGAQNEPTNRFCDQCGTRLTGAAPTAPAPTAVSPDQPTALAPSCPVCGATVLPGERFCDNCGADLLATPVASPITPDQATLLAPPSAPQLFCPDCGDPVLPGERFCDNCGADLSRLFAPPPAADTPTVIAPPPVEEPVAVHTPPASEAPAPTPAIPAEGPTMIAPPVAEPPAPPVAEPPAPPVAESPAPPVAEPPAPPATSAAPAVAPIDLIAERARLEALLAAHRDTVAQYEQMAARYPAGSVPTFITAGLDAARAELAKTEAELAALPTGPDPAEVARLEALLAAHRDTIAQYAQMAARYPAGSVPAFITAGLDAARAELAKTEAELVALTGSTPTPAAPAAAPAEPVAAHPAVPTPIATPIPTPPPAVARLELADGSEIILEPGKHEYVIGREDPVSNIFPEIDLTSYGGESGGVSRQHAKIVHTGDQWSIVDLNSTNHTRVNGTRIEPQTPTPISDGTKLQFGRLVATFRIS
ncbi:zinc-ribbon domain-containing protein [uncultured Chloroflexus sp.]|uniref:zinc-ribbon domain-containing protein n=1 Tax=uncultured Chloroflexus sp. TaxID=214040 RepID=UPI002630378D|nr:zinc ribbon domain-containing protein [uncultured Chloroflexus sp.]